MKKTAIIGTLLLITIIIIGGLLFKNKGDNLADTSNKTNTEVSKVVDEKVDKINNKVETVEKLENKQPIKKEEALKLFGDSDIKKEIITYLDKKNIRYTQKTVGGKKIFGINPKDFNKFGNINQHQLGVVFTLIMNDVKNVKFKLRKGDINIEGFLSKDYKTVKYLEVVKYPSMEELKEEDIKENKDEVIKDERKVVKKIILNKDNELFQFFENL